LLGALHRLGLSPQVQETTGIGTHNAVAAHVFNVLARVPGRNAGTLAVLLVAHYDGVPPSPAAGDDAAAVGALLETLRALRASPPLSHDVIVLFSDGEEAGLTGAAAFTREHPWARDVGVILNFEGRGTGGPSTVFETAPGNLDAVRALKHVDGTGGTSLSVTIYRQMPNDSDLSELFALGQPALNFGFADGLERYHSAHDDVAHLDVGSVQHHGVQALALTRLFADGPLPRPSTGDAVFFSLPALGLVIYPQGFAVPGAITAAALVLAALVLLRRREHRWLQSIGLGIGAIVVSTVLAAGMAAVVMTVLDRLGDAPPMGGPANSRGLYAAAVAMLALSLTSAFWTTVRHWASPASLRIGALVVWAVLGLVVAIRLPGVSFLFLWPVVAAAGAVLIELVSRTNLAKQAANWTATIVVASVIVPVVYTIAVVILGMAVMGGTMIGLVATMTTWLLGPQLETIARSRRAGVPVAWLIGGVALGAAGTASARVSAAHPEPSILAYAFDADTSRAWLLTPSQLGHRGSWDARVLGPAARTVVPRAPAAGEAPPEWLTRAIGPESRTLAAPAPNVAVGLPELTLVSESQADENRRLEIRVRPAAGTYSLRLRAVDTEVVSSAVNGRMIDTSRYRSRSPQWTLGYVVPPVDGFLLTLVVPKDKPVDLDVITRSIGLPPAVVIPSRPENVVPIHAGDQTVTHHRARF